MFKAFKWAYDMGVRQERVRIAAQLQEVKRQLDVRLNDHNYQMQRPVTDKKELAERENQRKQYNEVRYATDTRVRDIIDKLFEAQWEQSWGRSIMFPEEKK